jgi:hypothetical protein
MANNANKNSKTVWELALRGTLSLHTILHALCPSRSLCPLSARVCVWLYTYVLGVCVCVCVCVWDLAMRARRVAYAYACILAFLRVFCVRVWQTWRPGRVVCVCVCEHHGVRACVLCACVPWCVRIRAHVQAYCVYLMCTYCVPNVYLMCA